MASRPLLSLLLCWHVLAVGTAWAQEGPLAIYYFHRPPFYLGGSQPGGQCRGLVLERACRALEAAGVPYSLVELPVKRVINQIKWGHYGCGVGWYKLAQRQSFANFSLPLYHGGPLVLMVNRQRSRALPPRPTVEQLLTSGLVLGILDGYAYGPAIDPLVAKLVPSKVTVTGTPENMMRMVASQRCDYWLASEEETRWLLSYHLELSRLVEIRYLADPPPTQDRRLMCSKAVPTEVMDKIDQAIRNLPPTAAMADKQP